MTSVKDISEMSTAKKIRMTNLISGFLMIIIGAFEIFLGTNGLVSISHIPSVYLILFGFMTCAGDLNVPFVLEWCGFLGHFLYRGIFTIYCSVNLFHVTAKLTDVFQPFAFVGGWIVFALGVFLIAFGTCFKSSEYAQDVEEFMATKQGKTSTADINISGARRDTAGSEDMTKPASDLSDTSVEEDN